MPLATSFEQEYLDLRPHLPRVTKIYSSPLSRCRQLADRIAKENNLDVQVVQDLAEMNFGRWQGCQWSGIPRNEIDAWANDFLHYRAHGGESVHQLRQRVAEALDTLQTNTLAVTHAGVIRAALFLQTESIQQQAIPQIENERLTSERLLIDSNSRPINKTTTKNPNTTTMDERQIKVDYGEIVQLSHLSSSKE